MDYVENILGKENVIPILFSPCLHDISLYQISVINDDILDKEMIKLNVSDELKHKYKQIFNQSTMSPDEIKELLINTNSCMKKVFDVWSNSRFKNFELSSVGIAIAHANYRRRTGITLDLSMWIN